MRTLMWAVALILAPSLAVAGAWTREAGGSFFKLGYDRWFSNERFDADGQRIAFQAPRPGFDDASEYRNHALRIYGEYGYTETLTLIGSTAFEFVESEGRGKVGRTLGFSDLYLQLRQRLLPGPVVVSVMAEGKIPTGYDHARSPALGTGAADWGARLAAGGSLGLVYVTGEAGYTVRGGGRLDRTPFALEAGYSVLSDIMIFGGLRGAMTFETVTPSVQQPDGPGTPPAFDPATADSRFLSIAGGLALRGRPLDVVLGVEHMLSGENTLAGTRFSLSIWHTR